MYRTPEIIMEMRTPMNPEIDFTGLLLIGIPVIVILVLAITQLKGKRNANNNN